MYITVKYLKPDYHSLLKQIHISLRKFEIIMTHFLNQYQVNDFKIHYQFIKFTGNFFLLIAIRTLF